MPTDTIKLELSSSEAPSIATTLSDTTAYVVSNDNVLVEPDAATAEDIKFRLITEEQKLFIAPGDDLNLLINGKPASGRTAVQHGDWVTVGTTAYQIKLDATASARNRAPADPPAAEPTPSASAAPRATVGGHGSRVVVGRHQDCTLTIDSPLVSREHAHLTVTNGQWSIEDLGSANGTFLNGRRVVEPSALKTGDRIGFSTFLYRFTGDGLIADGEEGRVRIEALGITKQVRDRSSGEARNLLDDISLVIEPGEFVVIFGGSGSGKSTLLDTLNGRRPATNGRVLYNGVDFYAAYDMFRSTIGYVPQQDIVHRGIKMRRALEYAARLRLPTDTAETEIAGYVDEVLANVRLQDQAEFLIDTPAPLSGGQLKRVSLAAELIAKPSVLFLDEVTSGLDAGTDRQMMQTFAELADGGKTVVCVTHTLENIGLCNLVVLLHRGRLAYFGPPDEALAHFGLERLSDIYEALETKAPEYWAEQYASSQARQKYVSERLSSTEQVPTTKAADKSAPTSDRGSFWRQSKILTQRNVDLILGDKRNLAILLLQAPLIGGVLGAVFETSGPLASQAGAQGQIAFMLVLSAIWFGCLNSAREIVKELPVYLRERSVNLGLAPYILSKLAPLAVLCLIQCVLLLGVVSALLSIPGDYVPRLCLLSATAFAAAMMGLAISAFVNTNDKAIALVPILLIPQVVLSNALARLDGANLIVAKISMISFWAYDAFKSTLDPEVLAVRDPTGSLLVDVLGSYWGDLAVIALMTAVFIGLVGFGLKLKDRKT